MSESNQSNKFFSDGLPPVPIPPADQGWEAMRRKLDTMMPVNPSQTPGNVWQAISGKTISVITAVATTAALTTYLLVKNIHQKPTNTTVAENSVSSIQSDAVSADTIQNSANNFPADGMDHGALSEAEGEAFNHAASPSESPRDEAHTPQQLQNDHTATNAADATSAANDLRADKSMYHTPAPASVQSLADRTASSTAGNKASSGEPKHLAAGNVTPQMTGNNKPVHTNRSTTRGVATEDVADAKTVSGQERSSTGNNNTPQTAGDNLQTDAATAATYDTIASSSSIGARLSDLTRNDAKDPGHAKGDLSDSRSNEANNNESIAGKDPQSLTSAGTLGRTNTDKPSATTGSRPVSGSSGFSTTAPADFYPASSAGRNAPATPATAAIPKENSAQPAGNGNGNNAASTATEATADAGTTGNSFHPLDLSFIRAGSYADATRLQGNTNLSISLQPVKSSGVYEDITRWRLYLQLNIAAPLYRRDTYIVGPDGKQDISRNLIPAIRIERKIGRGALSVDGMPAINNTMPKNEFRTHSVTNPSPVYDTLVTVLKQFGWGLSIQYRIPVYQRFSAEMGLQSAFLKNATIRQSNNVFLDPSTVEQRTKLREARQNELDSLHHVRFGAVLGITYDFGKWQAGVRSVLPLRPAGRKGDTDIKSPVQLEIVLRWKVFAR